MEPPLQPSPLFETSYETYLGESTYVEIPETSVSTLPDLTSLLLPLTVKQKTLVDAYLATYQPSISECTFTNLFCWNVSHQHYFCEIDGHLIVGFLGLDKRWKLYSPIGSHPAETIDDLCGVSNVDWVRIDATVVERLEGDWAVTYDRDNSDYLYILSELRALKGKKYHRKRAYIQRCEELQPSVVSLDASLVSSCLALTQKWLEKKEDCNNRDAQPLEVALKHFDQFHLSGVGIFIGGTLEAFGIGEPLNQSTFVSHFLKANVDIPGLFQFASHAFACHIPASYLYLNKEQDLGIAGLRIAKEGWCPSSMAKKYSLSGL